MKNLNLLKFKGRLLFFEHEKVYLRKLFVEPYFAYKKAGTSEINSFL
jgi:hypothetical protein